MKISFIDIILSFKITFELLNVSKKIAFLNVRVQKNNFSKVNINSYLPKLIVYKYLFFKKF